MNNATDTSLIVAKIQLLKSEIVQIKRNIEEIDKNLLLLKNRKSDLENQLKYQQNIFQSFKNIKNFNIKFI